MSNNNSKRNSKYQELELIKARLTETLRKQRLQVAEMEKSLEAVTLAIQVWKREGAGAASKVELNPHVKEFRGLTQVQALIKIAKDNGTNRFALRDAKKILLEAGVVRSRKNANNILYTAIQRSGKFKRVAPGEYEVVEIKPKPIFVSVAS